MARFKTINDIINQVALEIGVPSKADVFSSTDPASAQFIALANSCGYELLQSNEWQNLRRQHQFFTKSTDDGIYDLPSDFGYMIDQTGWERRENVPLFGPLSAQEWSYLLGRDLVSFTIYASFRLTEGKFYLFPYAGSTQEPPDDLDINYEYISRNWVDVNGGGTTYDDKVVNPSDVVLYEAFMFERLLKARFLEARGFDSSVANKQFEKSEGSWEGKDKSAPVLNTARGGWSYPYLDTYNNTPDTGFGQ